MPLIIICAAALLGLTAGDLSLLDPGPLWLSAVLALTGAALSWRQPTGRVLALATCAAALGALRGASETADQRAAPEASAAVAAYLGQVVTVEAQVSQAPARSASGAVVVLQVQATAIGPANSLAAGQAAEPDPVASPAADGQAGTPGENTPGGTGAGATANGPPTGDTPALSTFTAARPATAAALSALNRTQNAAPRPAQNTTAQVLQNAGPSSLQNAAPATISQAPDRTTEAAIAATTDHPLGPGAGGQLYNQDANPSPAGSPPGLTRIPPTQLRVVGDPARLDSLTPGEVVQLLGRLVPPSTPDGRGPPTVLFPTLRRPAGRTPAGPAPSKANASAKAEPSSANPTALLTRLPQGLLSWLGQLRQKADRGIRRYLGEPQASLAVGVLLGGSAGLEPPFRLALQRSGLSHIVAIDGFKLVLVAAVIGGIAVPLLGKRLASVPTLLGLLAYTLLTGAHPAAVRAGLMVSLALLAALTGRVPDPLTSLLLALLAMAALDPPILLDVGLQLSLSAVLGIALLWPRLRPGLRQWPRWLAEPAGLTVAVSLASLPVVLNVFQQVSLISPLAHVIAVPLLPGVLVSAALLALASPFPMLAGPLSWLAWLPSTVLALVVSLCGGLPGAALSTGRLPSQWAVALAAGLLGWGVWGLPEASGLRQAWVRLRRRAQGTVWATPLVCIGVCCGTLGVLAALRPDGQLHVERLAVGRGGEAVFIRGPTGRTAVVVSGRPSGPLLATAVGEHLAVWEHKVDRLVRVDLAADDPRLGPLLARYPPDLSLPADDPARPVDLGGGIVVPSPLPRYTAPAADAQVVERPPPAAEPQRHQ